MSKQNPAFEALCDIARNNIRELEIREVKPLLKQGVTSPLVLDIREESEWLLGHLPDARHLPRGILERDIESIAPDYSKKIILYCMGGYCSVLGADNLQKMGYANVYSMSGGYLAWLNAEYPTIVD